MGEMIKKIFASQIKATSQDRVLEFTISTETQDRDGEVVKANGGVFDNYLKNPVVLYAHQYQDLPVAKTIKMVQKGTKTIASLEFPTKDEYEYADTICKLCKGGYLNTVSIGFIPLEWKDGKGEKEPRRTYTRWELLEYSIVPVPSNPDALISARNAGVISLKEFDFITKPEETEDYFRVPVPGEGGDKHSGHRIRTIEITAEKGIKALYCGEDKVVITYLFSKEGKYNWTMAKAEAWVKEHGKSAHEPRLTSQEELADNLEFTLSLVKTVGISDEIKTKAIDLADEIRRLTGGDIPVHIKNPIRTMLEPVIRQMTDYHDSHCKFHEGIMKNLEDMCDMPDMEHPEMPEGDDDMTMARAIVQETVNQILRRN